VNSSPGQVEDSTGTSEPERFDAIIIGAGVGGLYAIYRLRKLGLKVRGFEAAGGVGGTWYWNRYPGCRCDVESMEYSYSFSDELQQEWHWPERYGTQPEILKYINHVADRFDLRRDIEFNTRVKKAAFDSKTSTWTVTTDRGQTATARFCIMATGNLSTPRKPDYPGLDSFKGKWYHTGLWPHEGVDFTGLRVGVIGTGSSGVQSIPIIAKQAKHLYVFQRTANFSLPARNAPLDPAKERAHKAEYPERRRAAFDTPFGIAGYPAPVKSALDAAEDERLRAYEAKWAEGGSISFLYSFTDLLTDKESNETASKFVRRKIRATVKDPRTAELLCPDDHPIGTKRLILDTDYYETYNRDNVTLVDIRSRPIKEITPHRTAHGGFRLRARRDRLCDRFRCHDRGDEGDRHPYGCRDVDQREMGRRPAHLSRHHDRRVSESLHDHRPAKPRRQKPDDLGLRAARGLDRRLPAVHAQPRALPHRSRGTGRSCLGAAQQRGRGPYPLSLSELVVCRRQYPREASCLHAICRRGDRLQEEMR
jgi:cation diffusion facilitator CzcD-associated flavoprotein CzcO